MDRRQRWQRSLKRDALAIEAAYAALQAGSDDPEALHTLRVAVRGLRAALAPFSAHPDIASVRAGLGALAHDTNALRDDEVIRALLATLPGGGTLLAMLAPPADEHTLTSVLAAHRAATDGLHRRILLAVDALDQVQLETASRQATRRARRKLHGTLTQLTPATPAHEWHAARLQVKKARYLHDGQALWLGKRWQRFGPQCKPAQEALGHLHDLDVLHQRYGNRFDPALETAWQQARRKGLAAADAAVWTLCRTLND
ncbi:CHAD domain-containing protein [Jeongeupia naejangsanensis]|uniref:CHAD domain-containing protein n=1 Tax=Jeongeupia naejangsanensis TaxID=613195 RepID=A0ABS2BI69_9NEIS|nr:CHAD domain-containing protein [Jeongeupia naejangsanensis]MBM3114651.1 CHAD domain-containing protein [Jeongeupia naejangsanensis]